MTADRSMGDEDFVGEGGDEFIALCGQVRGDASRRGGERGQNEQSSGGHPRNLCQRRPGSGFGRRQPRGSLGRCANANYIFTSFAQFSCHFYHGISLVCAIK